MIKAKYRDEGEFGIVEHKGIQLRLTKHVRIEGYHSPLQTYFVLDRKQKLYMVRVGTAYGPSLMKATLGIDPFHRGRFTAWMSAFWTMVRVCAASSA